jgi:hypothetical protein
MAKCLLVLMYVYTKKENEACLINVAILFPSRPQIIGAEDKHTAQECEVPKSYR